MDITEAFDRTARRYLDHLAIVHNGRAFTYAEIEASIRAMAARLGERPGTVGVMTARSPHTVIALLGVLAAGGTYCPIDPAYPAERQRAMLAAARCATVLDAASDLAVAPPTALARKRFDARVDPETPAYVLFTSGSTGKPKPVLTPRRAIAAAVGSLHDLFGLTPADRVLQFASLNWDTCFEEILPTLTAGATLVFDDEAYTGSFPRLLRMIAGARISVLNLPTAFWHELVLYLSEERIGLPECVRLLVIGGEAVSPARLAAWHELDMGGISLVNTYGCTETTLITHAVELRERDLDRVPIGRALPHVVQHIGDGGELLIGGPSVALGYLDLPEATQAKFVDIDGVGRCFRTGDRVSHTPDGMLVPQGRLDHEVKVRGVRVDPAEVEALIAAHPEVGSVAVGAVSAAGRTILVAHVVPRPHVDDDALAARILIHLRAKAPEHLVPGRILVVPRLVYTASGKVDRVASIQGALP